MAKIFFLIILFYGIQSYGADAKYTFDRNNSFKGLVFEKMADAVVSYNSAKLNYQIDLTSHLNEIENFKYGMTSMNFICDNLKNLFNSTCQEITSRFETYSAELKRDKRSLLQFNRAPKKSKRGLLDFTFSLFSSSNYNALEEKISKQVKSYIALVETLEKSMNNQNEMIALIKEGIDNHTSQITRLDLEQQLHSILQVMTLIKMDFDKSMSNLISILYGNSMYSILRLVSFDKIKSDLDSMKHKFHAVETVPALTRNNIRYIAKATSNIHKNLLLIQIEIPIVLNSTFDLFKTGFIPININNQWYTLESATKHFISDKNFTKIFMVNNWSEQCREIGVEVLCKIQEPVIINPKESCELSLMSNFKIDEILKICSFTLIPKPKVIIQLPNKNEYFVISQDKMKFAEICDETHFYEIYGSGSLFTDPNCTYNFDSTHIYGKKEYLLKGEITGEDKTDFSQLTKKILQSFITSNKTFISKINLKAFNMTEEFDSIRKEIDQFVSTTTEEESFFGSILSTIKTTIQIIIIISLFIFSFKFLTFLKKCFGKK